MTIAAGHAVTPAQSGPAPRARWRAWALAAICVAAAMLYAWKINAGQFGNTYYSAAVKSMTQSFTNFLFGSFDPYGVFTVDKPPMALWAQALSALIFGYHGWALLLPQVIEGVAAVFLLHRTVRGWAGENAALVAAGILALTPITVAINRDNNPDTLLVLLLIGAAYAFTRSVQANAAAGRTRWLLLCAFLIGCGFLTKMLQAWIIVPGVALAYFVGSSAPVKRRLVDLLGAGMVLFVSSFWWVALHDWWPGDKPYIGGSADGSAWDLIFGYNGFGRIFGDSGNATTGGGPLGDFDLPAGTAPPSGGGGFGGFGGESGATRMFGDIVGGQISWLLPLCLLVLVAVAVAGFLRMRGARPGNPAERAGWFLWGSWLLVTLVVFSYAQGIWHPYYTTMLAPAIAAVSAAGVVRFWRAYRAARNASWLLLPLAIVLTVGWAFVVASRDTSWYGWTRWACLALGALALAGLVLGRMSPEHRQIVATPALTTGLVAMLLVPAVWSAGTAAAAELNGTNPTAGPSGGGLGGFGSRMASGDQPGGRQLPEGIPRDRQLPGVSGGDGAGLTEAQRRILDYAKEHSEAAKITLAVNGSAMTVAPYIIDSDENVIAMGGFSGSDNTPSVDQLETWVAEGTLRFVLSDAGDDAGPGGFGGMGPGALNGAAQQERRQWIQQHCAEVDPSQYGGGGQPTDEPGGLRGVAQTLYDCRR
ncbi:glycosyltransferase family 39 protein [Saccharomonospora sp. NPDC046836]|uniref:ArnT family glycosyltransferase n=1 Tax=Saccharomonospora sp. NPDC046836 TaxID=3156921 RepID=UPI0033D96137